MAKVLDATIHSLAECGYAKTSTAEICKRAGISQGGLFRHFSSRLEVIVAATEEIEGRHLNRFHEIIQAVEASQDDSPGTIDITMIVSSIVGFIRESARTIIHAAWHEVMVAARSDERLRQRVSPSVKQFEEALLSTTYKLLGVDGKRAERLGMVVLSIMHMFDSEAVTVTVYPNAALEAQRVEWASELLRRELQTTLSLQ